MWSHPQGAVHMVAGRLGCERAVHGTVWATSHPLSIVFICSCTVVCMVHSSFRTFSGSCVTSHPNILCLCQ